MQRYFVSEKENDRFILSSSDSYHVIKVMRMNVGENVEIVYDSNQYLCEIISLNPTVNCKILNIIEKKENNIPRVVIAQSLVKEQKMDYILQKSTELGVYKIMPVYTERSIIKLEGKKDKKIDRWRTVLKEASEQSKRIEIPILENVVDLKDVVKEKYEHKYICSVNEKSNTIKSVLSKVDISDTILFVIGPEGGLSQKEEEFLLENGFEPITFGNNVLRTETASLFVLSVINYEFMR